MIGRQRRRVSLAAGRHDGHSDRDQLEAFCHWALVSKGEETVRGSCFCSWCARWRPTGCGRRRQRVPISKAEFSSQVSSGIPLAPSPADPSPCREAQSDSGGCSIACLALGETEVVVNDTLAMENDADFGPGYGFRSRCGLRSSRLAHFDEMMPLVCLNIN